MSFQYKWRREKLLYLHQVAALWCNREPMDDENIAPPECGEFWGVKQMLQDASRLNELPTKLLRYRRPVILQMAFQRSDLVTWAITKGLQRPFLFEFVLPDGEATNLEWLTKLMRNSPNGTNTPYAWYKEQAIKTFKISGLAFRRDWGAAQAATGANWSKRGPKKKNHASHED